MLSEYCTEKLAGIPHDTHLRLGLPRGITRSEPGWEHKRRFYMSTLPEADLVYRLEGTTWILEFGVWRPQTKIGQLLTYKVLLPDTPGYLDTPPEEIRLKIVVGRMENMVKVIATQVGVDVEVFERPWLTEALASRSGGRLARGVRLE